MASHAGTALTLIEAAIESRLSGGAVVSSSVDGVSLARATLAELYELRRKYKAEVDTETDNFTTRVVYPNFSGNLMET